MSSKENIAIEARTYELLDDLTRHEGWKILLTHINKVRNVIVDALLKEKDINKVSILQERHRAFSSVIMTLQSAKAIKEKLHHDIQLIIEDENNIREFDI